MLRILNLLLGKRWWYSIDFEYIDVRSGQRRAFARKQIGFVSREDVLDMRKIRKAFGAEFLRGVHKENLCNGIISVQILAYLGRMKRNVNTPNLLIGSKLIDAFIFGWPFIPKNTKMKEQ